MYSKEMGRETLRARRRPCVGKTWSTLPRGPGTKSGDLVGPLKKGGKELTMAHETTQRTETISVGPVPVNAQTIQTPPPACATHDIHIGTITVLGTCHTQHTTRTTKLSCLSLPPNSPPHAGQSYNPTLHYIAGQHATSHHPTNDIT